MSLTAVVAATLAVAAPSPAGPIEVEGKPIARRRESFPRRADYRAFLRESGQSTRDIRMRVALDPQSDRLRALATAGIEDPEEQQAALWAWVVEWRRKWSARTVCRAPWITTDCGNAPRRG